MNGPGPTMVVFNGKQVDFYDFFEVDKNAGGEELKRAYRAICMRMHPDKNIDNPKAEENFKVVQAVWEVLSNPYKRREYDIRIGVFRPDGAEVKIHVDFNSFYGPSFSNFWSHAGTTSNSSWDAV